jgi:hypothetical protein
MTTDWSAVANLLREAHDLIIAERNWCKGSGAVTPTGRKVSASDPDAVAWCALGALSRVAKTNGLRSNTAKVLWQTLPFDFYTVTSFNDDDDTTHGDVLDHFLRAIKWAEEQATL